MSSELRPCPFCGGEAAVNEAYGYSSACVYVACLNCNSSGSEFDLGHDGEAIAAWNKRAERTCKLEYVEGWTGGTSYAFRCTACGEMSDTAEFGISYCPQCGALVVDDD